MRVGIDAQLRAGTATGIGEYVAGLVPALRAEGVTVSELAWPALDPWRFDRRVVWDQLVLPLRTLGANVDLLHCAAGTMPAFAPVPIVVTVHDVAWLRVQAHARPYARAYFGALMVRRYRRAAGIVVDSLFSRAELLAAVSLDPDRVSVVYPGVAGDVMRIARRRDDVAPIVLAVGTVEARKNLAVVIRAIARVPRVRLVSVGPPTPYRERCLALAHDLGIADRVELRGYVPRADVLDLYARACVAVVPSRYEGFGYGAAQGLCAGTPLVVARAASLPEVAPESLHVDPDDVAGWAEAIASIVADPEPAEAQAASRREAACARYAWPASARAATVAYAAALLRASARGRT